MLEKVIALNGNGLKCDFHFGINEKSINLSSECLWLDKDFFTMYFSFFICINRWVYLGIYFIEKRLFIHMDFKLNVHFFMINLDVFIYTE